MEYIIITLVLILLLILAIKKDQLPRVQWLSQSSQMRTLTPERQCHAFYFHFILRFQKCQQVYLYSTSVLSKTERLTNKYHLVIIGMWHYRSRQAVSVLTSCAFILYREEVGPMEYIIITLVLILLLILAIKKDQLPSLPTTQLVCHNGDANAGAVVPHFLSSFYPQISKMSIGILIFNKLSLKN